jgi:hypothetical protein
VLQTNQSQYNKNELLLSHTGCRIPQLAGPMVVFDAKEKHKWATIRFADTRKHYALLGNMPRVKQYWLKGGFERHGR